MIAIETKGMIGSKIPPRAMWLTLLDSAKKEIESELVPFADSYNVSTLVVKMTIVLININWCLTGSRSVSHGGLSRTIEQQYLQRQHLT